MRCDCLVRPLTSPFNQLQLSPSKTSTHQGCRRHSQPVKAEGPSMARSVASKRDEAEYFLPAPVPYAKPFAPNTNVAVEKAIKDHTLEHRPKIAASVLWGMGV